MNKNTGNKLAALGFFIFCASHSIVLSIDLQNDADKYIVYFSMERIKKIVKDNKNIILSAFPEDASIGWHCIAEDPLLIFKNHSPLKSYNLLHRKITLDTYARQIFPLEQLWLKNHRKLHSLILSTALKAALQELKPTESVVNKWVKDYIAFFFEPVALQPTIECPWPTYDVRHFSFLSDRCPKWLRPMLEKFSQDLKGEYPQLYLRLEKTRRRLELYTKKAYASQVASQLLNDHGYIFLHELATGIAAACPSNSSKHTHSNYYAQWIIDAISRHFKLSNIEGENYKKILIDKNLASRIARDAVSYFIKKQHNSYALVVRERYVLDGDLLKKIIAEWSTNQALDL